MPRTILLFDLDGTLVDSAPSIAAALSVLSRRRGGDPVSAEFVRPLVSLGAERLVHDALGSGAGDPAADLAEFREVLKRLPADPASVYPGVSDVLEALAAAGHRMGIVTNKPEGLSRTLLAGLDLARHFPVVVGGDTAARCKPDPAPALHALEAIGGDATEAIFIGDSDIDAATAAALDLPFLLFEGGYGAAACTRDAVAGRFASFAALPAAIAALDACLGR